MESEDTGKPKRKVTKFSALIQALLATYLIFVLCIKPDYIEPWRSLAFWIFFLISLSLLINGLVYMSDKAVAFFAQKRKEFNEKMKEIAKKAKDEYEKHNK